jgi:hypothetical protein
VRRQPVAGQAQHPACRSTTVRPTGTRRGLGTGAPPGVSARAGSPSLVQPRRAARHAYPAVITSAWAVSNPQRRAAADPRRTAALPLD